MLYLILILIVKTHNFNEYQTESKLKKVIIHILLHDKKTFVTQYVEYSHTERKAKDNVSYT